MFPSPKAKPLTLFGNRHRFGVESFLCFVASTNGDASTQDDVLFKSVKLINLSTCSGGNQDTSGVLEARGTQEGIGRQTGLGNAKQ